MNSFWAMLGLLALALCCLPLAASTPRPASTPLAEPTLAVRDAWGGKVELDNDAKADRYRVRGSFEVPVPAEAVWGVLSDYPHLAGVVKSLVSSRILGRDGDSVLMEQVVDGRFLFFRRTLVLRLRAEERRPTRIDFTQAAKAPFRFYEGAWILRPEGPRACGVDYLLTVSRGDLAPRWLEPGLFRGNAEELLRSTRQEILRRAALATAGG